MWSFEYNSRMFFHFSSTRDRSSTRDSRSLVCCRSHNFAFTTSIIMPMSTNVAANQTAENMWKAHCSGNRQLTEVAEQRNKLKSPHGPGVPLRRKSPVRLQEEAQKTNIYQQAAQSKQVHKVTVALKDKSKTTESPSTECLFGQQPKGSRPQKRPTPKRRQVKKQVSKGPCTRAKSFWALFKTPRRLNSLRNGTDHARAELAGCYDVFF
jgi:hypothetical protein